MNDQTVGLALRRVRLRRNERQEDVAARAGLSPSVYSTIELGRLETTSLRSLRAAAGRWTSGSTWWRAGGAATWSGSCTPDMP